MEQSISEVLEINKTLDRAPYISMEKVHSYIELPCINSKPQIMAGDENLLKYSLPLQLHVYFCNPKKTIELLKQRAENREPFDWTYKKEYKGTFVIEKVSETLSQVINEAIIYAEITVDLLEVPTDKNFTPESTELVDISQFEQYGESSNKFKDFTNLTKESIVNNIKNAILSATPSRDLSNTARSLLDSIKNEVIKDVINQNSLNLYTKISNYTEMLKTGNFLSIEDTLNLIKEISEIPEIYLKSTLRGGL